MARRCKDGTRDHKAHPRFKPVPSNEQRYVINRITPAGQRRIGSFQGVFPTPQMIYEYIKKADLQGTVVVLSTRPRLKHIVTVRRYGSSRDLRLRVLKSSHDSFRK